MPLTEADALEAQGSARAGSMGSTLARLVALAPLVAGICLGIGIYTVLVDDTTLYYLMPGLSLDEESLPSMGLLVLGGVCLTALLWLAGAVAVRARGSFRGALRAVAPGFLPFLSIPLLYFANALSNEDTTMWAALFLCLSLAFLGAWVVAVALVRERPAFVGAGRWLARHPAAVLAGLALLYFAVSAGIGLLQYRALTITYSDTADFDEMLWRTLHGQFLATTCFDHSFLGQHIEFVQLFLLPIYMIRPGLPILLVLLSAGLASGVVPVYLLAKHEMRSRAAALLFAAAYIFYAPMQYLDKQIISNPFLPEVFYVPLMLWAVYFLVTRRNWMLLLFSFLVVSCKEELALPVAMFGVILMWRREWRWGASFLVGGLAWFLLAMTVAIPWFEEGPSHVLGPWYYGNWGTSPGEIARNVLSDPFYALQYMTTFRHMDFLVMMLVPMAFLALFSPSMMVVFAPSMISLCLATWPPASQIYFHYHLSVAPWPIAGAIIGAGNLSRLLSTLGGAWGGVPEGARPRLVAAFCGVLVLGASAGGDVLYGKFPVSLKFYDPASSAYWRHLYVQTPTARFFIDKVLPTIPTDARVSATECLATRFTHHAASYQYGSDGEGMADYVVLQDWEPLDTGMAWAPIRMADDSTRIDGFKRILAENGIYVFKRTSPKTGQPVRSIDR